MNKSDGIIVVVTCVFLFVGFGIGWGIRTLTVEQKITDTSGDYIQTKDRIATDPEKVLNWKFKFEKGDQVQFKTETSRWADHYSIIKRELTHDGGRLVEQYTIRRIYGSSLQEHTVTEFEIRKVD